MQKAFWQAIKANDFAVPDGHQPAELLPELLSLLGSTDSELRDDLALEILATWIIQGRFTEAELRTITTEMAANLKRGIGESGTDSVFLRTFSPLILRVALDYDAKQRILSEGDLGHLLDAAVAYLADEQDQRGYIPVKGWAHACAHTADMLGALARHPGTDASGLHRILVAIGERLKAVPPEGYIAGEEARLASAVVEVLRREELALASKSQWLRQLIEGTDWRGLMQTGQPITFFTLRTFLSDLLIQVTYRPLPEPVRTELMAVTEGGLRRLTPWLFR